MTLWYILGSLNCVLWNFCSHTFLPKENDKRWFVLFGWWKWSRTHNDFTVRRLWRQKAVTVSCNLSSCMRSVPLPGQVQQLSRCGEPLPQENWILIDKHLRQSSQHILILCCVYIAQCVPCTASAPASRSCFKWNNKNQLTGFSCTFHSHLLSNICNNVHSNLGFQYESWLIRRIIVGKIYYEISTVYVVNYRIMSWYSNTAELYICY